MPFDNSPATPAWNYAAHLDQTMVTFEGATITLRQGRDAYRALHAEQNRDWSAERSSRILALWNAINRADKRAKGLPLDPVKPAPYSPARERWDAMMAAAKARTA